MTTVIKTEADIAKLSLGEAYIIDTEVSVGTEEEGFLPFITDKEQARVDDLQAKIEAAFTFDPDAIVTAVIRDLGDEVQIEMVNKTKDKVKLTVKRDPGRDSTVPVKPGEVDVKTYKTSGKATFIRVSNGETVLAEATVGSK